MHYGFGGFFCYEFVLRAIHTVSWKMHLCKNKSPGRHAARGSPWKTRSKFV